MKSGREGRVPELLLLCFAACLLTFTQRSDSDLGGGFIPQSRAANVLRVVTWNLGTGVDAGTTTLQDELIEGVGETLRAFDADLIFLQELQSRRQLKALAKALGGEWQYTYSRPSNTRGLAALGRRGKLKREYNWSLKRAIAISFAAESGARLLCIGMHADAFSARDRNQAIGLAASFLQEHSRPQRTLLAGDLNLDLDIDKRRDLFTDDEHLDVETYNFLANRMLDTGLGHGQTAKPDRRIDYIFVESDSFEVLAAGPWSGHRLGGMDHEPLAVDLLPR